MPDKDTITISRDEYYRLSQGHLMMRYTATSELKRISNKNGYKEAVEQLRQQIYGEKNNGNN